jgi:hypothetical protein
MIFSLPTLIIIFRSPCSKEHSVKSQYIVVLHKKIIFVVWT